jgi:hypothetical protein
MIMPMIHVTHEMAVSMIQLVIRLYRSLNHQVPVSSGARLTMRHSPTQGHQHSQQDEQIETEGFHTIKFSRP